METHELVSVGTAVISAIGGAFAAWAAHRSAESAQLAQQAAVAAEHRATLRQISVTATEVLIEAKRIAARGNDLKLAYRTLFTFAGQRDGSRQHQYDSAVDEKLKHAAELSEHAKLFTATSKKLDEAPPEETDRVQVRLSSTLTEIRALREDLERELSGVEAQFATYQDKSIKG